MSNGKVMQVDEFRVGDLVRVEKGEHAVEDRCTAVQAGKLLFGAGFSFHWYAKNDYTLILLDRPAPPSPTAFGSVVLATIKGYRGIATNAGTDRERWRWRYLDSYGEACWVAGNRLSDVTVLFDAGEVKA